MIIIPLSTDAPVYHPPRGTFFLIAINVGVFIFQLILELTGGSFETFRPYYLHYGSITPVQWVTSIFLHAGLVHLLGNMIFLWIFGLIVEGKIGAIKFLLLYLVIGTAECAVGQIMMLNGSGAALGASAAIFGLLAISFVWAPRNDIHTLIIFWIFPTIFETYEISVLMFCFYMLAWEVIAEVLLVGSTHGGQIMSSAFCHLAGAAIGAGIGFWMLKSRRVDCEGFDIISVVKGKEGQKILTVEQEEKLQEEKEKRIEEIKQERQKAIHFIKLYLEHGNPDMALARFKALKAKDPSARWNINYLMQLIELFVQQKRWDEACEYLAEYSKLRPERAPATRLKQAEIQIQFNERPSEGLKILKTLDFVALDDRQTQKYKRLVASAREQIENGELELAD